MEGFWPLEDESQTGCEAAPCFSFTYKEALIAKRSSAYKAIVYIFVNENRAPKINVY